MEIEKQNTLVDLGPSWIKLPEYPLEAVITHVEPVKGKFRLDYRLILVTPNGEREFDAWGDNLRNIAGKYGKDYSVWIGKTIHLKLEGNKRIITV